MKLIQLIGITTCFNAVLCLHSYAQGDAPSQQSVQTYRFNHDLNPEYNISENADANIVVFEQKKFSTALYDDPIAVEASNISAKAIFKNLEVYLIYGSAQTDKKKYTTLNEALKTNMAKVDETSTVGKLSISNNSDQYIYINSGDIVKGGKQDRTIKYDIVVAPHAQNVDLASFCVEHNRWSQRGNEKVYGFASSERSLSSSDLKVAARHNSNQSEVWHEVKDYQVTTNSNLNTDAYYRQKINVGDSVVNNATLGVNSEVAGLIPVDVTKNESSSSLELTLENKELNKINDEYKKSIVEQLGNRDGAVGIAYFINGKLYNIDVYNNHQLFADLFDKLLDASISEAISIKSTGKDSLQGDIQLVNDFLKADAKVYVEESVNTITQAKTSENNTNKDMWIFSTIDLEEKTWIHRNWIIK